MNLNIDPEWLLRMAEKEDCRIISVGGFFTRDEPYREYWGRSVCRGYLPMWSWLHWRFEWLPSAALLDEWIKRCEIG